MVGKKKLALLLCSVMLGTSLVACTEKEDENKKIGIIQFVQHPALDDANKGFIEGLKEKGYEDGKNITIDYKNAQGKIDVGQTISTGFVNDKVDLIFAIATPVAQTAYNATKDIPIVVTAVTDPVDAKLAKSMKNSETNITGTSDAVQIDKQIELLKKVVPNVKTLGVIYTTSEANSILQVKQLKEVTSKLGIELKEIGVSNVTEINQNLPITLGSIDALYVPTDNNVASAYTIVNKLCLDKKIPVFCAEEGGVTQGGLITLGINYFNLGKVAAYKAVEIFEGKKPSEIEISLQEDCEITINEDTAKKLGITIPDDISSKAKKVTGGV